MPLYCMFSHSGLMKMGIFPAVCMQIMMAHQLNLNEFKCTCSFQCSPGRGTVTKITAICFLILFTLRLKGIPLNYELLFHSVLLWPVTVQKDQTHNTVDCYQLSCNQYIERISTHRGTNCTDSSVPSHLHSADRRVTRTFLLRHFQMAA